MRLLACDFRCVNQGASATGVVWAWTITMPIAALQGVAFYWLARLVAGIVG